MSDAHDKRKFLVRLEILKALNSTSGYALRENILHRDVNLAVQPAVMLTEFRATLTDLEEFGLITIVGGSLGAPRNIRLTDNGRAEVAANP